MLQHKPLYNIGQACNGTQNLMPGEDHGRAAGLGAEPGRRQTLQLAPPHSASFLRLTFLIFTAQALEGRSSSCCTPRFPNSIGAAFSVSGRGSAWIRTWTSANGARVSPGLFGCSPSAVRSEPRSVRVSGTPCEASLGLRSELPRSACGLRVGPSAPTFRSMLRWLLLPVALLLALTRHLLCGIAAGTASLWLCCCCVSGTTLQAVEWQGSGNGLSLRTA